MGVDAEIIRMVKTNKKGLCKNTIDNMTKDCSGSYCLVLKIKLTVTSDRPLIFVGYKYNIRNFLSFVATDNAGITTSGIPYLYNHPDPFSIVSVIPLAFPLIVSKLFVSVNDVDSHKKYRQSDLAL